MPDTSKDIDRLSRVDALADLNSPYELVGDAQTNLFSSAMVEIDQWHCRHNDQYARLFASHPRPFIPVGMFKSVDLATSVAGEGYWFSSSGTGQGGKTRVFYDAGSLARIQRAMIRMFDAAGFLSKQHARFLLFSPDPRRGDHAGYATAFLKFTACAPVAECVFAVDEKLGFDGDLAWETLKRWACDPTPIYIFGLTVFFEHLCLCGSSPVVVQGPVRGITGGGWKGITQRLSRPEIIACLASLLQTPTLDIRDIYGMTEHPLHYLDCLHGHFHPPAYSRFSIIGEDGVPVAAGETGLIALENPFFASLPSQRLLTEDLGVWGKDCPCGLPGIYMSYMGRASSPQGTCAAQVA
jgi:hypothetical protein